MDHGFFTRASDAGAAPLLLDLLLEEIHAGASEEEEQAFFLSIGAKLAERFPVEGLGEVDMLEQHLNGLFGHLGLGVARLEIGSDALIIRHRLPGADSRGDGQNWLAALPPVLEGPMTPGYVASAAGRSCGRGWWPVPMAYWSCGMDCDRRALLSGLVAGTGLIAGGARAAAPASGNAAVNAAWAGFSRRFLSPEGRIVDTGNGGISHSEGQGYGLLLAESAGDRAAFEAIWHWTVKTLFRPDVRLFAWRYDPSAANPVADTNNATDGDLLIAWALLRAARRWQVPVYAGQSATIRQAIRQYLVRPHGEMLVMLPGLQGFAKDEVLTLNPSYYVWPALQAFAAIDQGAWVPIARDGTRLLGNASFGTHLLPTDWVDVAPDGHVAPTQGRPARFGYDAIRVPLYLALAGRGGALRRYGAFWNGFLRNRQPIPAWVDVLSDDHAPYPLSSGGMAVVDLVAGTRPRLAEGDYYSSALGALASLAPPLTLG